MQEETGMEEETGGTAKPGMYWDIRAKYRVSDADCRKIAKGTIKRAVLRERHAGQRKMNSMRLVRVRARERI